MQDDGKILIRVNSNERKPAKSNQRYKSMAAFYQSLGELVEHNKLLGW